jgi:D-3-phosphoglycerate dehydrogenase
MKLQRVMIMDEVHDSLPIMLRESGLCEILDYSKANPEKILERLAQTESRVHGLVVRSKINLDAKTLSIAAGLQWIARAGSGQDGIDTEYAQKNNITLFHASEGNRLAVAEHVGAMILAWLNRLIPGHQQILQGVWDREGNRGSQLSGTTVGLVGYGHNGSQTAHLLAALGCKVLVYDKFLQNYAPAESDLILESGMDDIYREARILTLHTPLTELTRNLVQWNYLSQFRQLRLLINAARGPIVNLSDLLRALDQNLLEGACLDTLPVEDPQRWDMTAMNRVLAHPRILLSPHVAGWTDESYKSISEVLARKILAHLRLQGPGLG